MIKVLQNSQYWLEPTQTWLHTQITYLPDDIHNAIACHDTQNLDRFPHANIHAFTDTVWGRLLHPAAERNRLTKVRFALYNQWIYRIAKQTKVSILHSHFGPLAWHCHRAAGRANLQHVVTFYGNDVNQVPAQNSQWLERYKALFNSVDCVLCEGPYMANSIIQLGCPEHKVKVHHLGIQLDKIQYNFQSYQVGEPLKILIAASFREKKGIPYAIEAIGKFAQYVPVKVTVIGDAGQDKASQQEKKRILQKIKDYNLENTVTLRGYQPYATLLQAMQNHHIFLSPSVLASSGDSEGGTPVSIIEASASGMMVVSTTHCDIPNVIKHGETGLLAPERDVDALVDHLVWLSENPDKWERMAHQGREHIGQNFDATVQGQKLGEIYCEVATRK